jgi:hypothetical protein
MKKHKKEEKIYYTNEVIDKSNPRFTKCKNKGFDCNKEEFMAIDLTIKFCTGTCGTKFKNRKRTEIKKGILPPIENNIKILQFVRQNSVPVVSFDQLLMMNFKMSEYDKVIVSSIEGKFLICFGNYRIMHLLDDKLLILKQ